MKPVDSGYSSVNSVKPAVVNRAVATPSMILKTMHITMNGQPEGR